MQTNQHIERGTLTKLNQLNPSYQIAYQLTNVVYCQPMNCCTKGTKTQRTNFTSLQFVPKLFTYNSGGKQYRCLCQKKRYCCKAQEHIVFFLMRVKQHKNLPPKGRTRITHFVFTGTREEGGHWIDRTKKQHDSGFLHDERHVCSHYVYSTTAGNWYF